ncbi:MAG: flagellin [Betaproteobacteria bacterium]|jgi:flagellin
MPIAINTNLNALFAQAADTTASKSQSLAMQRLSTGLRINSAKDDAAGLAISNRMTSTIKGLSMAIRNANDGINMAQTADGALSQTTSILQRMRELAVQASNASNSADNRASMQQEVSQLKTQIDQIAKTTNFNDINLLDGSATKLDLQIGANQGQTMTMNFDSAQTKDIGVGSIATLTSNASSTVSKMVSGDLTINGVQVGASLATSDNVSYETTSGDRASSAIAKAAAINAVSAQSGVTATVNATSVNGSTMTVQASTGTITINGVTTASFATSGTDAGISRQTVVGAINNISSQTGVTAIDTGDMIHGVQLFAKDGRNITLTSTLATASTGLGNSTATTYTGTYTLASATNSPITLGSGIGNNIANSGLTIGTYAANTSQVVTTTRATTAAAPAAGTTGLLDGSSLKLNGVVIGAALASDDMSSDTSSAGSTKAASAIAIAAAINKSTGLTGVSAVAQANTIVGTTFGAATFTAIKLNGVTINSNNMTNYTRADVANLVNRYTGQTGVSAADNGKGITYTAADGRNIEMAVVATTSTNAKTIGLNANVVVGATATTTSAVTTYAQVALQSSNQFTVQSGTSGDANLNKLGFTVGTFGGSNAGLKIKDIDISTQAGAQSALNSIDAAIKTVSANQSRAGAFLNRLDAVVSNLTTQNTNMTASRSSILDTDYSTETTNLAKSQIISQAATAMLAQANQSAQSVLSLLK